MTDQPEKRAFERLTLDEKWAMVGLLFARVALLETRMYDLERGLAPPVQVIALPLNYIPEPTTLPPWPEITCMDRT